MEQSLNSHRRICVGGTINPMGTSHLVRLLQVLSSLTLDTARNGSLLTTLLFQSLWIAMGWVLCSLALPNAVTVICGFGGALFYFF